MLYGWGLNYTYDSLPNKTPDRDEDLENPFLFWRTTFLYKNETFVFRKLKQETDEILSWVFLLDYLN